MSHFLATAAPCVLRGVVALFALVLIGPGAGHSAIIAQSPLFVVQREGRFAYVRKDGTVAITPQFESAKAFAEGFAPVRVDGCWRFIDEQGLAARKPCFEDAEPFSEGLAAVRSRGAWGYVDTAGKMIIDPQYEAARSFVNGLAPVRRDGLWFFVDRTGRRTIPTVGGYEDADSFGEGVAAVRIRGRWGYVDETGAMRIPAQFSDAGRFANSVAPARRNGAKDLFGYIARDGAWEIRPRFMRADSFAEGVAAVLVDSLYGYIDTLGKVVLAPEFLQANGFVNGLAAVTDPFHWGAYINHKGELVARRNKKGGVLQGAAAPQKLTLESTPLGAEVYLIPLRAWELDADLRNSPKRLELFRVPEGSTRVETRVAEKVYIVLFKLGAQQRALQVDVSRATPDRVVRADLTEPRP